MLALEGQSLKYPMNMLAICILYYYAGPGNVWDWLLQVMLPLIMGVIFIFVWLCQRFVYIKDKKSSYDRLLIRVGLHSTLKGHPIQDMLITINSCFQEKAPTSIVNLLKVKDTKYNLKGTNMLSLPKVRTTMASGLFSTSLQRHGMRCRIRFAPWPAQGNF